MTEDTSPENLRKFLESDDPALVQMGLSMAKGSGVPEEMLGEILWMYMMHDDKTIRAAAKSVFMKHAPEEIQLKIKNNWKPSYRTLSITGDKFLESTRQFLEVFESQDDFAEIFWRRVEPLIKALKDKDSIVRSDAVIALGKIGDKRVVEPLIKALRDKGWDVRHDAATALGKIGDYAVEPLIKALEDENGNVRECAAEALGDIGDKRAVEPLIKTLGDDESYICKVAVESLGWIGDKRAVEPPLIKALGDKDEYVRNCAAEALGKIGDKRAVEPLIKALGDEDEGVRWSAAIALGKIGDKRAIKPLIKALQPVTVNGLSKQLSYSDRRVREAAKEALKKLGHEVK